MANGNTPQTLAVRAVFCVDEKSGIQALDRTRPVLPLRPGVPERQTHDDIRHGTTCVYAARRVLDGVVPGECRPKRDSKALVRFRVVVLAAGLLAALIPARLAARVDPMIALRRG